jgi:cardiolipin synthase
MPVQTLPRRKAAKGRRSNARKPARLHPATIGALVFVALFAVVFLPRPAEKAIGKQISADYSVADPQFGQAIGHLVGAPLAAGNRVIPLLNGEQIFAAKFDAIRKATNSVTLENFIFSSGKLSAQLVPLLSAKARSGVKVHVLVDSLGSSKLAEKEIDAMKKAGVQFVKYNHTEWHKLLRVNHRDHRKILVVDGAIGFTGGACLADEWMGNADRKELWRDTTFQVEGPAVAQLQGVFADNWVQTQHEVLHGRAYFPVLGEAGAFYAHAFKTGPRDGVESARLVFLHSIAAARKHIRIAHSYFVPDNLLVDALIAARERGVKVQVITPGIIDANVVRRASRARWAPLLEAGVEFFEYQPSLYHCKVMIVDDVWVVAGSGNFDNRSFRINDEDGLSVWSREFAETNIRIFEMDRARCLPITLEQYKARPWYTKAAERAASLLRVWL